MRIERARRILSTVHTDRSNLEAVLRKNWNKLNASARESIVELIWKYTKAERVIEDWLDEVEISEVESGI